LGEGVENHLLDAHLFNMKVDWYGSRMQYLTKGYFDIDMPKEERSHITIKTKLCTLYEALFYRLGPNGVLHQCLSNQQKLLNYWKIFMRG
jgi:hypothetical protein